MQKKGKKTLILDETEIKDPRTFDDTFNMKKFKKEMSISVNSLDEETMVMDLVGVDVAIANALRRIMIAEVPTMAFHKVLMYQNTSVLLDELLIHRIGLLPIKVDGQEFVEKKEEEDWNENNGLKWRLKVQCTRKPEYKDWTEEELEEKKLKPDEYLNNCQIYSKDMEWIPICNQKKKFKSVELVHQNILLAKLRQNQEIWLDIYAEKGIGKKHAKWSPVSTAFYRLMPQIIIEENFLHEKSAQNLVQACPMNVFSLKKKKAVVNDPRSCTTCRECVKFEGVKLQKLKEHFIFTVESSGIYSPSEIFMRALSILEAKSKAYTV